VAVVGSASDASAVVRKTDPSSCSLATLHGTYLFAGDGWSVSGGSATATAVVGSERYDGTGHVQGIVTSSTNGAITRGTRYTATYTVVANCPGPETVTISGTAIHFDLYIAPSGTSFRQRPDRPRLRQEQSRATGQLTMSTPT
jgi:hypothetical protein